MMIKFKYLQGVIAMLTVFGLYLSPLRAAEKRSYPNIPFDELIKETIQYPELDGKTQSLVWWLPLEAYGTSSQSVILILVAKVQSSSLETFQFASESEIRRGLRVRYIALNGKSIVLEPAPRSAEINDLVLELKPFFAKFAGRFGNGLEFFTFRNVDSSGKKIVSPYEPGRLKISTNANTAKQSESSVELPLNSLFVPRLCPNGKPAHVTWRYCPWDGSPLPVK
jgi:hypothetical protein